MCGDETQQAAMSSYLTPEQRVLRDHPLRPILAMVDRAVDSIEGALEKMYAAGERPSIAPEKCCAPYCCRCRALGIRVLNIIHLGFTGNSILAVPN